jgi:hypothetical protein
MAQRAMNNAAKSVPFDLVQIPGFAILVSLLASNRLMAADPVKVPGMAPRLDSSENRYFYQSGF